MNLPHPLTALAALAFAAPLFAQEQAQPVTPASVVEAAPSNQWIAIAPEDLLVMELAPDAAGRARQAVIQLLPEPISAGWTGNVRRLARAHWWDGLSIYRSVDNWVVQWGAGENGDEEDKDDSKPLPAGLAAVPESQYVTPVDPGPEDGRDFIQTPERAEIAVSKWIDSYAITGFVAGWPVGLDDEGGRTIWPLHCYGAVGVARDLSPDTGTGAELYAVIGHAPRQLDRNIALVGRVIAGTQHLSILPRGTGDYGVYESEAEHTPILSVRLGDELPEAERPRFEYLDTTGESFASYLAIKANRNDEFYRVPAGGIDACNVAVPVREMEPE